MRTIFTIVFLLAGLMGYAQQKESDPEYPEKVSENPLFQIVENKELGQHFVRFLADSTYTDWFLLSSPQWTKSEEYSIQEDGNLGVSKAQNMVLTIKVPAYGQDDNGGYYLQPYYRIGPEIQHATDTVRLNRPLNDQELNYLKIQKDN